MEKYTFCSQNDIVSLGSLASTNQFSVLGKLLSWNNSFNRILNLYFISFIHSQKELVPLRYILVPKWYVLVRFEKVLPPWQVFESVYSYLDGTGIWLYLYHNL